ncbi:unnamed protein product [Ostreobium quekettii]|uniref:Uncharacterized protein n=1 Tax=Ostreobium quekettii TaxID=121088 RepID=A0A8S1IQZ8_9CHLO|nr:unnamed protein product [Ostreobium quekettii]|eukprot:evm.model.scf_103EXC.5 EVM.evm.TU.scf_103EXC.5   scf_103EXC:73698-74021(+)
MSRLAFSSAAIPGAALAGRFEAFRSWEAVVAAAEAAFSGGNLQGRRLGMRLSRALPPSHFFLMRPIRPLAPSPALSDRLFLVFNRRIAVGRWAPVGFPARRRRRRCR